MLRQSDLFSRIRGLGLTVTVLDGEYRITYPVSHYAALYPTKARSYWMERQEVDAAYTDDRDDAYGTAIVMSKSLQAPSLAAAQHTINKVLFG